jgi:hypothetical protein
MIRLTPRPAPVSAFDVAEDVVAALYRADTIARWTGVLIDGDHMSSEAARAMATSCAADLSKIESRSAA